MKPLLLATIFVGIGILAGISINVSAEESLIPSWIKTKAKLWVDGKTSDKEFLKDLQYLVDKKILKPSPETKSTTGTSSEKPQQKVMEKDQPKKETKTKSGLTEQPKSENKITKITPLSGLLPVREDVGTDWRYPTTSKIYDEVGDPTGKSGFVEYSYRGHSKGSGYDMSFLDLYIYRFDSSKNAKQFYTDHVNGWINKGGYKEWKPSPSAADADDCYGRTMSGMMSDKVALYCVKNNVVVFSLSAGYQDDMKEETIRFNKAVLDKL